jgi:hypothetical protein
MTTTLIYEPIASISDDYFRWPEASRSESSRDNTGDQGLVQAQRLALNITDGNAIQPDCNSPEAIGQRCLGILRDSSCLP